MDVQLTGTMELNLFLNQRWRDANIQEILVSAYCQCRLWGKTHVKPGKENFKLFVYRRHRRDANS